MEEMASLWNYQESMDELKQKLLYTTIELESVRMEAREEIRKHEDYMKQLVQFLKIVSQERDEARGQLQKLLNKIMPCTTPPELFTPVTQIPPPQSPIVKPAKANSSVTESNSLSETYNYHELHSHSSSPVDSIFDAVSSPELSNINIADSSNVAFVNQPFVQDYNGNVGTLSTSVVPKTDQASLIIDTLLKGKSLPQKGKLLQAVLEAGPLLQTLLVAGPLPRWRNPPPVQAFHIPPVSVKGDAENVNQNPVANFAHVAKPVNHQLYAQLSCGSSQMLLTSMLNFGNGPLGSSVGGGRLVSGGSNASNSYVQHSMSSSPAPSPLFQPSSGLPPFSGLHGLHWDPWVVALVGAICTFFLVFSYYRILQRHCSALQGINFSRNRAPRRRLNQDNPDDPSLQFQSQALDSFVMRSLPIVKFKKKNEDDSGQSSTECAVCLGEFEEGEWLKHLPNCSHIFHVSCIDTWFQSHSNCPLCRSHVFNLEYSISVCSLQETLRREEFHQEGSAMYQVLRSHILQNTSHSPDPETEPQNFAAQHPSNCNSLFFLVLYPLPSSHVSVITMRQAAIELVSICYSCCLFHLQFTFYVLHKNVLSNGCREYH
ncbi:hypothetical protein RJ640_015546, partial [Escallonia rubra]